ncbi:hypothetical protein AAG570_005120 [Ranatra chinensis]|uniref:Uncharacterized protein n=1 Tax=Ranatra chinensis TaxID=642074 RepID=A0ABD0XZU7_9HEMI
MVTKYFFLALVATCFAGLMAEQAIPKDFNEFMKMTEKAVQDISKHIGDMLPQTEEKGKEVWDAIKANANTMATNLQEGMKKIHDELKDHPELTKFVDELQTKVNEQVTKLRSENPELAANAEKLHESFVSSMRTVIDEVKKVEAEASKEGGVKDTMDKMLQDLVEKGKQQYQTLEQAIHDKIGHGKAH